MSPQRFLKFLVVLALALWASTAFGQSINSPTAPSTWTPTYALSSGAFLSQVISVTATQDGTAYSLSSDADPLVQYPPGLMIANIVASGFPISINAAAVDAAYAISGPTTVTIHLGLTSLGNSTGTPDAVVTITLTVAAAPVLSATGGATPSISLSYTKGSGAGHAAATAQVTVNNTDPNSDTYSWTPFGCPGWLIIHSPNGGPSNGSASSSQSDPLTFTVNNIAADGITGGATGSCNVTLAYNSSTFATVTVNYTITSTGTSPLAVASPGSITLTYVRFAGAQASALVNATINSTDIASEAITATVQGANPPTWLAVTPTANASISSPGHVTFAITPGLAADSLGAGNGGGPYTVNLVVGGQAALAVQVTVVIQSQVLAFTTTSAGLGYMVGTSGAVTNTAVVKSTAGNVAFTPDGLTVPWWLNASAGTANPTSGATVTFTGIATVLPGMPVGNYSANVGFLATVAPSSGVAEFYIKVSLTVSATASTISLGPAPAAIIMQPGAPAPTPVVTPVSSNAPVGFTAACSATTNTGYVPAGTGCTLQNGSSNPAAPSVTGVAYTWGTPLDVVMDAGLFASSTPFGAVVTVTISVAPTNGSTAPPNLVYTYNFQPVAATLSSVTPTSVIAGGANPVVVTLKGANFVSASAIVGGGSLAPTEVFLSTTATVTGTAAGPWTQVLSNVVVVSPTVLVVTIPAASFPTLSGAATSAKLFIGVANQTGSSAPNPSLSGFHPDANLIINATSNPVIYSVTSTASFDQPNPGSAPNVAPYELVSIFGANFGATSNVIATPDSTYNKYPTSLTVGTSGAGSSAKPIIMKVTFAGTVGAGASAKATTYNAPILFANANQINVAVPSGLNLGSVNVQVASGTSTTAPPASDAYPVNYVAAWPGIFTLTSTGTGQGAILNPLGVVNGPGNGAQQGVDTIAIYMTGLGAPNSTATDSSSNSGTNYPGNCVSVSSYLSLVNTSVTNTTPKYTAPSPVWTGLEGALMLRVLGGFPPCMLASGSTLTTVSFNGGPAQTVSYAGFVDDSVAGLYQVNVPVPAGLTTVLNGPVTIPVTVTIGGITSPPVNVVVKP